MWTCSPTAAARSTSLLTRGFTRTAIRNVSRTSIFNQAVATGPASSKPFAMALNLPKWLEKNADLLKPPINNYCVYHPSDPSTSGLTVMVVGGPNARTDYHINETPEFFYQHRGSMLLKTVDMSTDPPAFVDVPIHENSLYLLPANTPHNPVRFADTVGVVLEQARPEKSIDRLRWYCKNCKNVIHEASFHCSDLGSQVKEGVQAFDGNMDARTCKKCGTVNDSKPAPGEITQPPRFPQA